MILFDGTYSGFSNILSIIALNLVNQPGAMDLLFACWQGSYCEVTPDAVKKRFNKIYHKLGIAYRHEAMAVALARGIFSKRP